MTGSAATGAVHAAVDRCLAAGRSLRAAREEDILHALVATFAALRDPGSVLGREARALLPESTGLSPENIEWALDAALSRLDDAALHGFAATRPRDEGRVRHRPVGLGAVVLSANVFTACVEPVLAALLARVPLVLKASSRDDVFPRLLALAWRDHAGGLADALEVVSFPRDDHDAEDALLGRAHVAHVYGHDQTLADIRARLRATTTFVGHGSGLGAIYVGRDALRSEDAARTIARAIADDVAAYDQRGCLSPHAVWVEPGGAVDGRGLAELVARAGLEPLARSRPRGALRTEEGAAQMQWRGVATARGELFEGDGYAVSFEAEGALRLSPGFRNVAVHTAANVNMFGECVAQLGAHLKCVGFAGATADELLAALPANVAPALAATGRMQRPELGPVADGQSRWLGFVTSVSV
ncbi:MAG: acyl-CoA reductase [Polyangiales bacterium]|nr:hypothetical protein [Myxococcales bacterium]